MNKVNSIFDVLGPIMIGPSSSHTAGAARLAKLAREICGESIKSVKIYLHGSFSKTYKGHGSDRALIAGILGYEPQDERLRNSLEAAKDVGLKYEFIHEDLGHVHPNSVKFEIISDTNTKTTVVGASVGGGAVIITNINGFETELTGDYDAIITKHEDKKGVIKDLSNLLYFYDLNIANMKVIRNKQTKEASMIVEIEGEMDMSVLDLIKESSAVKKIMFIKKA